MTRHARPIFAVAFALIAVAGCQPAAGSFSPSVPPSTPAGSAVGPSSRPSPSSSPGSSAATGQTDTAWGRIWDSLPAGFPTYPDAMPAPEAATGPASAWFSAPGVEAATIVDWMQSKLEQATYSTDARSGPLEDGSYVLESSGSVAGCRVQVSIAPLGGLTTITVLYGASCPKP
jgi:hypothetical protein